MLERIFPRMADNHYPGRRLGLWLFGFMTGKIILGLNVMLHAPQVARSADGVPVDTFGAPAAAAFSFMFAAWGLGQVVLGLLCLIVLLRYRSLVPLVFLILLAEQLARLLLRWRWPFERLEAPGAAINLAFAVLMLAGLGLSLWRPRASTAAA